MKVKAFVKDAAAEVADEELRAQYEEVKEDGKSVGYVFVPEGFDGDARDYYDRKIAPGLKSALEKERDGRAKMKDEVSRFKKLGMEAEDLEKLVGEHKAKMEEAAKKVDPTVLEDLKKLHEKERKADRELNTALTQRIEALTVDREISEAMASTGANPRLLKAVLRDRVKLMQDDDGNLVVRVVKEDGKTVRFGDSDGNPMTVLQLAEELRESEDYLGAFNVEVRNGGGKPADKATKQDHQTGKARSLKELATDAAKAAFISKNGLTAFQALPKE